MRIETIQVQISCTDANKNNRDANKNNRDANKNSRDANKNI